VKEGDTALKFYEIRLTKNVDVAGPRLWLAAVTGQTFCEIRVEAVLPPKKMVRGKTSWCKILAPFFYAENFLKSVEV
jgi:hypothetical protein